MKRRLILIFKSFYKKSVTKLILSFTLISYVGNFVGSVIIFLAEEFVLKKNNISFYWSIEEFSSLTLSATEISKKLLVNVFVQSVGMIIFHLPPAIFLYLFYYKVFYGKVSKIFKGIRMSRINFYIISFYFFIALLPFVSNIGSQHNVVNLLEKFLIFQVIFLSAFLEEFIHRGMILNYLKEMLSVKSAVFISSLIFSLTHVDIFSVNFFNFVIDRLIFGIIVAVIYEISGDFLTVTLLHALNNYMIILSKQNLYFTLFNIPYISLYYLITSIILLYFIEKSKNSDSQITSNDKISNNLLMFFNSSSGKRITSITLLVVMLLRVFFTQNIKNLSTSNQFVNRSNFIQLILVILILLNVHQKIINRALSILKNNSVILKIVLESIIYFMLIIFLSPKFKGILLSLVILDRQKNRYAIGKKATLILTLLIILTVFLVLFWKIIVINKDIQKKLFVLFFFMVIYFFLIGSTRQISLIVVGGWIILYTFFHVFEDKGYELLTYFYYSAMIIIGLDLYKITSIVKQKSNQSCEKQSKNI